jgi:hypothetical protein
LQIPGAQTSLNMAYRYLPVEGSQRRTQYRRRISLQQYQGRAVMAQVMVHRVNGAGGEASQRLVRLHELQIPMRGDTEDREYLVEHLPMLSCDAHPALEG